MACKQDGRLSSKSGPWGGSGGNEWNYTPKCGNITLVTIGFSSRVIESLVFQSKDGKTETFGGGSGQPPVNKVDIAIDYPNEYITGISGTTDRLTTLQTPSVVVTSLNIFTNFKEYGPFGSESGDAFSFREKDVMITGFFGRSGWYIDAIGVYHKPSVKVPLVEGSEISSVTIAAGPWGGPNGGEWSYRPQSGIITQITVAYFDYAIKSLAFHSQDGETETIGDSDSRARKEVIHIDYPNEFLTGISGTTYRMLTLATPSVIVGSLILYTNLKEYGPFGRQPGDPFSFQPKDNSAMITGFFGRAGWYIDAIGVYYKSLEKGPWGGEHGQAFDDGVFSKIKQINVHFLSSHNVISGIQIKYVNKQGEDHWSPVNGTCGGMLYRIEIDSEDEFLTGIQGFYGPVLEGSVKVDAIKSLTFYTNKGEYGPIGTEAGEAFTSPRGNIKVVGFFGYCKEYLNAIGVHIELI